MPTNHRILIRQRPNGALADEDLEHVTEPLPTLADGEALVRTCLLAMDPVTRVMLSADIGVMPPIPLGAAVRGFGAGEVIASRRHDLPQGAKVSGLFEWSDYQHIGSRVALGKHFTRLAEDVAFEDALNLYGHTAHAAFFGMINVGAVTAGESVVITGAAGAVGSVAGQIAKVKGAKVIGIAGGAEKCRWLIDELGFDATVDYKSEDVGRAVRRLCQEGIDVLFDNIGGPMRGTLIAQLAHRGRVVLCGSTSQYLGADPLSAPFDVETVRSRSGTAARFNAMDYASRFEEATDKMLAWRRSGDLQFPCQVLDGLNNAPHALNSLFEGKNRGRLLVRP
jgi:NADPH-dependent curcumin reductase CurA